MRKSWSKILRGVADVASGIAEVIEGGDGAAEAAEIGALLGIDPKNPTTTSGQLTPQTPEQQRDALAAQLADQAREFMAAQQPGEAGGMAVSPPPGVVELPSAAEVVDINPEDLPESPERHRQINEGRRRKILRDDPINALEVAEYWLLHLSEQPFRSEDWTLCIEALPGTAQDRFEAALQLGMSQLGQYAAFWDACYKALLDGKAKAQQLLDTDEGRKRVDTLLDMDREGRILFWLGDRPDVEALVQVERAKPTGEARIGGEHIEGPPGSVQAPADEGDASVITGGVGPEVMSPDDEAEVMHIVNAFDQNNEGAPGDALDDRAAELAEELEEEAEEHGSHIEGDLHIDEESGQPVHAGDPPDAIRTEPGGEIIG